MYQVTYVRHYLINLDK